MYNVNEKRKNYYIAKKFQRNFILKFCGLITIGALLSGGIIYAMSMATVSMAFEHSRLVLKSTADYILPAVLLASAVVIVLIGFATVVVTLFASHKIAGAVYRMEKNIEEVTYGNLKSKLSLRRNDELKPLAVSIDVMAQVLRHRLTEAKKICSELELVSAPPEVQDAVKRLRESLDKFKTD